MTLARRTEGGVHQMKALYFGGSAALLSILACSAPSAAANPLVLTDVRWIAEPASGKKAPRASVSSTASRAATRVSTDRARSEEHTSELQSLMRISYAVFCLKKKKKK